jgi:ribosomal protein L37E
MPITELDDDYDEDWYDDQDDPDDGESGSCPECGETVHEISDRCPACGYWLSDGDRRAMWAGESQPMWQRITAVVLLLAFLISSLLWIF